jgi:hypothetical protein
MKTIKHNIQNLLSDIDNTEIIINNINNNNNKLIQKYKNDLNIIINNYFIISQKVFN